MIDIDKLTEIILNNLSVMDGNTETEIRASIEQYTIEVIDLMLNVIYSNHED